ncbi:HupE/UreJ family protein [Gilvimarinus sp. F26214L]|uniref:HupE/UreJ family protein n=1 Tax=Gilvimarinus sp. DZF01 TaxID=3461371 RepID=UPI0040451C93
MIKVLRFLLPGLAAMLWISPAWAPYLDLAQFTIVQQNDSDRFRLEVTLPENVDPSLPLIWPTDCTAQSVTPVAGASEFSATLVFDVSCAPGAAGIVQTRWGKDGGTLETRLSDGSSRSDMLPGGRVGAVIALPDWQSVAQREPAGFWQTAWRYLELGTVHVLVGWDHLAFVFCLALLATGTSLLWLISAFTLGHSISLALAHLDVLNIPIAPVEAIIALSVVFMAREAILAFRKQDDGESGSRSLRWRAGVTAAFGLIHGLGFASVLGGLGVSPTETVTALLFFNIGVEIGQILFVVAVIASIRLFRLLRLEMPVVHAATYGVGGMGLVWTLERVVGV